MRGQKHTKWRIHAFKKRERETNDMRVAYASGMRVCEWHASGMRVACECVQTNDNQKQREERERSSSTPIAKTRSKNIHSRVTVRSQIVLPEKHKTQSASAVLHDARAWGMTRPRAAGWDETMKHPTPTNACVCASALQARMPDRHPMQVLMRVFGCGRALPSRWRSRVLIGCNDGRIWWPPTGHG
jgi:hypothetical protein